MLCQLMIYGKIVLVTIFDNPTSLAGLDKDIGIVLL